VNVIHTRFAVEHLAASDVNSDGKMDIVAIQDGGIRLYLQSNPTTFLAQDLGELPAASSGLTVTDLNLDRRDDLMWLGSDDELDPEIRLHIYLQQPDGSFARAASPHRGRWATVAVGVGDGLRSSQGRRSLVLAIQGGMEPRTRVGCRIGIEPVHASRPRQRAPHARELRRSLRHRRSP
jgi:hypothetical protein